MRARAARDNTALSRARPRSCAARLASFSTTHPGQGAAGWPTPLPRHRTRPLVCRARSPRRWCGGGSIGLADSGNARDKDRAGCGQFLGAAIAPRCHARRVSSSWRRAAAHLRRSSECCPASSGSAVYLGGAGKGPARDYRYCPRSARPATDFAVLMLAAASAASTIASPIRSLTDDD